MYSGQDQIGRRQIITKEYEQKKMETTRKKIDVIQANIDKVVRFRGLVDNPGWNDMEVKWIAEQKEIDDALYEFDSLNDREILILLAKRREVVKMVQIRELVNREIDLIKMKNQLIGELDEMEKAFNEKTTPK